MFSQMRYGTERSASIAPSVPQGEDRWARDMQEDMKQAIHELFEFKKRLDKLHPDCISFIEQMLQYRR